MTATALRQTVASPVRVEGVGLFTGAPAAVTIAPAERGGDGIAFERAGVRFGATIASLSARPAHPAFAQMPPRNTTLAASAHGDAPIVHTVEHLLAALAGLGVTDAVVRAETDELPIGDGSCALFTGPIADAGIRPIGGELAEPIRVREPVRVGRDGASITIEPADRVEYVYRLDYGAGSPIPAGTRPGTARRTRSRARSRPRAPSACRPRRRRCTRWASSST
jgi:UDP-3-O-[3-hydroxymyristoyl] N-acetylglucosamine deacetylase